MKKTFNKVFLIDELDLPGAAISDKITSKSRWSEHHEIIFTYENKFWKATYSCGATEQQDESPWQYTKEVECTEVHQVEEMVKVWREV